MLIILNRKTLTNTPEVKMPINGLIALVILQILIKASVGGMYHLDKFIHLLTNKKQLLSAREESTILLTCCAFSVIGISPESKAKQNQKEDHVISCRHLDGLP